MEYFYVDESGSMTRDFANQFPYFIICTIRVKNVTKLQRRYKRFVSKYYERLKTLGDGRMFENDKFKELKGCCFDIDMKKEFANYFCVENLFEVIYIRLSNQKVEKIHFYHNKARAFNYLYKLMLQYRLEHRLLPKDKYFIQIDERNQKTNSKASLEDYLNTELVLSHDLADGINVQYFDSCNNHLIQIADVFSNIFYSYSRHPENYSELIEQLKREGYIRSVFEFPIGS